MKRKIALFLAAVMLIAAWPASVFASVSITVSDTGSTNRGKTSFVELTASSVPGIVDGKAVEDITGIPAKLKVPTSGMGSIDGDYLQNAPSLVVNLLNGVQTGDQFKITLKDGEWALPKVGGRITTADSVKNTIGEYNGNPVKVLDLELGEYITTGDVSGNLGINANLNNGTYARKGSRAFDFAADASKYNDRGVSSAFGYFGANAAAAGVNFMKKPITEAYLKKLASVSSKDQAAYTMAFINDNEAVITVLETYLDPESGKEPVLVIPMFIVADHKVRVTAQITSDGFNSSSRIKNTAPVIVAEGSEAATRTEIGPKINNYELFPIKTVKITELRASTLNGSGEFRLQAPTGYEFVMTEVNSNYSVYNQSVQPDPTTNLGEWIVWYLGYVNNSWSSSYVSGSKTLVPYEVKGHNGKDKKNYLYKGGVGGGFMGDYLVDTGHATADPQDLYEKGTGDLLHPLSYWGPVVDSIKFNTTRNGTPDMTKVMVHYKGLIPSSTTPGVVEFNDLPLMLKAESNAPLGDVKVTFSGDEMSEESIVIGTRAQWGITFKSEGNPTLFNGQYENDGKDDGVHKVGEIVFKENLPGSWLANRQTVFTLPEGVKIAKVEFDDVENIIEGSDNAFLGGAKVVYNQEYYAGDVNWGNLAGYVVASDREIVMSGLTLHQTRTRDTAAFKMKLWVTVESGWEGPIYLTVSGAGLGAEIVDPVQVATAKNPVNVVVDEATVTDLKIGYQWQKTADFSIVEAQAGILRRGDTVKLSISDDVHATDISFVDADFAVDAGDLKITNKRIDAYTNSTAYSPILSTIGSTGTISFDIAAASSKASTIKFTNVQVKLDRNVPESNFRPYNIVVWGNAIANNYDSRSNPAPATHTKPGITAKYIRVATPATVAGELLTSKIEITKNSNIARKNGKEVEMPTAAFADAASDSLMVPVRFVAGGLLDSEEGISWDEVSRTVTIYSANRVIQFTIGSDQISVNGVTSGMVAADGSGRPVTAQIRDEYSFIPLRALANALGVPVKWDPETSTATFNP